MPYLSAIQPWVSTLGDYPLKRFALKRAKDDYMINAGKRMFSPCSVWRPFQGAVRLGRYPAVETGLESYSPFGEILACVLSHHRAALSKFPPVLPELYKDQGWNSGRKQIREIATTR